jgi:hypothetical protein
VPTPLLVRGRSHHVGAAEPVVLELLRRARPEAGPRDRRLLAAPGTLVAGGPPGLLGLAMLVVVLLDDFAGQPPAFGDVQALLLRPGAYLATAFPARQRPGRRAPVRRADQARVLEEARDLPAKLLSMPGAEVNFVGAAIDAELDCLISRAASEVILQSYIEPLHDVPPRRGLR